MEKILVTGGSGFIGSALVKRLVDEGYHVRVFDNNSRGSISKLGEYYNKVEFIEGDIRNYEQVLKATKDIDTIFHLAYINGTKYFYEMPEKVLEVAVKGAINTLDATVENGIKKYVLASSSEVYQEPTTIPTPESERLIVPDVTNPRYSYGGGKIINELMAINYARKYNFSYLIFRPHNVYGPDMGFEHVIPEFVTRIKELSDQFQNKKIDFEIKGSGEETRAFCYIDDFIEGLMLAYTKGQANEIYHIGNDEEIKIKDLLLKIAKFLDVELNITHGEIAPGGTPRRCPDIQKLKNLGYSPKYSIDEGLKKTIEWYKRF